MKAFSIIGQTRALHLLARARACGRLAHAYLFTGPDGVGKASLARELAMALLCRHAEAGAPGCSLCPSCLQMQSGNHPDFMVLEPEGQGIKIDAIRQMKQALGFPPLAGALRVVLLKEVHTMRREAANSLLKILEEPPSGNLLLLTADDDQGLLATIRSRCQLITLYALPLALAAEVIKRHKPELTAADCLALAELSGGCPGQALHMEEQAILPLYQDLVAALETEGQGAATRVQTALALAGRLYEHRDMSGFILQLLRFLLKNTLAARLCSGGCKNNEQAQTQARSPATRLLRRESWNAEQLSARLAAIDRADQALQRNCNPALVFEVLLLQLIGSFPSLSPQA